MTILLGGTQTLASPTRLHDRNGSCACQRAFWGVIGCESDFLEDLVSIKVAQNFVESVVSWVPVYANCKILLLICSIDVGRSQK